VVDSEAAREEERMSERLRARMLLVSMLSIMVLTVAMVVPAEAARSADSMVIPPQASAFGKSYGEWSAAWWNWVLMTPADKNPLMNEGASCAENQDGQVWMLVGSFGEDPVTRTCTIPTGKAILIPIINTAWIAFPGETDEDWVNGIKLAEDWVASVDMDSLKFLINGAPVSNLAAYEVEPTELVYGPLPEGAIWELPAGLEAKLYSVGFYVLIKPLPPGSYTVHLEGANASFSQNVTYELTVAKR
jgi:hypothetical protein